MRREDSAAPGRCGAVALAMALACGCATAEDAPESAAESAAPESGWEGLAQFGAGYDTNANASTREQTFLGFTLDPRFIESKSAFGELTLGVDHHAVFGSTRGINSSLRLAHRANPDASFADQSVASLGTEGVVVIGATRLRLGLSAYTDWLDREDHERGANIELGVFHQTGDRFETELTLRAGRIGYHPQDLEPLDIDRYLAGLSFTRVNLGSHSASVGITLLGGRDTARRVSSPFGNNRNGAQLFTNWPLRPHTILYVEFAALRSNFAGTFFDLRRRDDQYEGLLSLEFSDWPAARWSFTPQLRYVRNDSTVVLFAYDRIEAALYLGRQF